MSGIDTPTVQHTLGLDGSVLPASSLLQEGRCSVLYPTITCHGTGRFAGVFPITSTLHHDCRFPVVGAYDAFISIQLKANKVNKVLATIAETYDTSRRTPEF